MLTLIGAARTRAVAAVNTTLIELYWKIGEYISRKIAEDAWGQGPVDALAEYIRHRQPNARGFSGSNLRRMRQFFETYRGTSIRATLLRKLPWSHNLAILSRCKIPEEREFYLKMARQEQWSIRDLQRHLNGALFERVVLSPAKLSPPVRVLHPDATVNMTRIHWPKLATLLRELSLGISKLSAPLRVLPMPLCRNPISTRRHSVTPAGIVCVIWGGYPTAAPIGLPWATFLTPLPRLNWEIRGDHFWEAFLACSCHINRRAFSNALA